MIYGLWAEHRRGIGLEVTDVIGRIGKKELIIFADYIEENVATFRGGR